MIYLDHAAATPVSKKALHAMLPYFDAKFFNPSSPYLPANATRHDYEAAKDQIAQAIGAKGVDLVMTSGATESINLAFATIPGNAHVLISSVEHPAVLENARKFKNHQLVTVDKYGRLQIDDFKRKLTSKTQFVSVCLASSELGTIQPISELASLVRAERQRRQLAKETTPLYFHCDASQGLGLLEVKVARLGVDLLTINSAKVYGPKGVGALFVARNVKIKSQTLGGGQEMGLRSGTENVPGVVAFAAALSDAAKHLASERKRLSDLREVLRRKLSQNSDIVFLGNPKNQLANFLPISVRGLDAERLIFMLEQDEVYLSTGAACSASKGQKSPTLQAIGLDDVEIAGSLRITLGKLNDEDNISRAADFILQAIRKEQERLKHG